jgi:hypothetical protein
MTMAAETIGRCKCPLCGSVKAKLSLAKSGLPVLTCNGCNTQSFARSERSDDLMRALLVREEPAPEPAPPVPAPAPEIKPAPAAPAKPAWGLGAF